MTLGVAAIFKDEAPYLREWLVFHRLQGVQHFWLYDNDSSDDWRAAIGDAPDVTVTAWPGAKAQMPAYMHCVHHATTAWLAVLDIDEYLWAREGSLADVLDAQLPDTSQLLVRWRMFGDGGHLIRPPGLTIENYVRCARGSDHHTRPIVRPRAVVAAMDPHHFVVSRGATEGTDRLAVNHYWTRSVQEARVKFARGRADNGVVREWSEFTALREQLNESEDCTLRDLWADGVRAAMA